MTTPENITATSLKLNDDGSNRTPAVNRLMIAGGGTGGHLFPGIAVAEEFVRRNPETETLFVGTGRPVEVEVLKSRNLPARSITAAGLKGKTIFDRLKSMSKLPVGLWQSVSVIREFRPDLVFGVGGYVSGPLCLASRLLGVPSAIHEQNSVPGMTNKLLGRLVDLVFISFESTGSFFPAEKTHLTGNPIRREIADCVGREKKERNGFTLLVSGGSQGAEAINKAVIEAMPLIRERTPDLSIVHQTGKGDYESIRGRYEAMGINAEVSPFISDMERVYMNADLIVCRAGALTVAEVAATRTPAVFIPLPTAADNHQEINALSLKEAGAAEILLQKDMTGKSLAETVIRLSADRSTLKRMSEAAARAAMPDAVTKICDICTNYLADKKKA